MSDNITRIRQRIVIRHTHGGALQLHHCFFLPTDLEGAYNAYDHTGKLLAAYVVDGQNFNFTVDDIFFNISGFRINEVDGHGNWNAPALSAEKDGTFQAHADGGAVEAESASAASAY